MNLLASGVNSFYGGYGYGGYGYMFDWTYLLIIAGLVLSLIASSNVKSTFNHYAKIRSMSGLTGAAAAERVLHSAGIYDVSIQRISGQLTDHYDPRTKTLRLSDSTYGSNSIAAVCVAAHECGHAIQDKEKYGPLVLRSTLVPAANFGSLAVMAGVYRRTDFIHPSAGYGRNYPVFSCGTVSARHTAGRVQCIFARIEDSGIKPYAQ